MGRLCISTYPDPSPVVGRLLDMPDRRVPRLPEWRSTSGKFGISHALERCPRSVERRWRLVSESLDSDGDRCRSLAHRADLGSPLIDLPDLWHRAGRVARMGSQAGGGGSALMGEGGYRARQVGRQSRQLRWAVWQFPTGGARTPDSPLTCPSFPADCPVGPVRARDLPVVPSVGSSSLPPECPLGCPRSVDRSGSGSTSSKSRTSRPTSIPPDNSEPLERRGTAGEPTFAVATGTGILHPALASGPDPSAWTPHGGRSGRTPPVAEIPLEMVTSRGIALPLPVHFPPRSDRASSPLDKRLAEIGIKNPEEADQAMVAVLGPKAATGA